MTFKVFIDGRHGTTGLKIDQRLSTREDIQLLDIDDAARKDPVAKAQVINAADLVFLCLPDDAARNSAALVASDNQRTRLIDASTAHRTDPNWVYGLPELHPQQRARIRDSRRVAVTGCHASGFILLIRPLVAAGVISDDAALSCFSLTGYSGGGKQMIADYQGTLPPSMFSPRLYGLGLTHKHLPEMQLHCGLSQPPLFTPVVGNFEQGMLVNVPLNTRLLKRRITPEAMQQLLEEYYRDELFVQVMPQDEQALDQGQLPATACNDTNRAELFVFGHAEQILLSARLDNLGKGASGAAVQCMNIMLQVPEDRGL